MKIIRGSIRHSYTFGSNYYETVIIEWDTLADDSRLYLLWSVKKQKYICAYIVR
jgi:hypothetical protein